MFLPSYDSLTSSICSLIVIFYLHPAILLRNCFRLATSKLETFSFSQSFWRTIIQLLIPQAPFLHFQHPFRSSYNSRLGFATSTVLPYTSVLPLLFLSKFLTPTSSFLSSSVHRSNLVKSSLSHPTSYQFRTGFFEVYLKLSVSDAPPLSLYASILKDVGLW